MAPFSATSMNGSAFKPSVERRSSHTLSSLRVVSSGSAWNAAGRGVPVVFAILITPFLVSRLGIDRWGLFTLALSLVGVAGIFDFGVSRALTRSLSQTIAAGETANEAPMVTTALWVLLAVSGIGGGIGVVLMPTLVDQGLNVPPALRDQAIESFRILAISTPLIVVNVGLTGVVAAYQRYRAINLIVIPVTTAYFVLPALTLMIWDSLNAVMLSLVACRVAYTLGCAWICFQLVPGLWGVPRFDSRFLPPLIRIGAWIAISSTLTPMLLYADRFLIGALMPLSAVSHYATPFDVVARFTLLPIAVSGALFPAIAASFKTMPERVESLLRNAAVAVAIVSFPPCIIVVGFAQELLTLWLGADFAAHSATILQLLAAGMFFACMSLVLDTLLDGTGRPDVTAKLMVGVTAIFVPLSAAAIVLVGIEGAAVVFMVRTALGCIGRVVLARKYCPQSAGMSRGLLLVLAAAGALLIAAMAPFGLTVRAAIVLGATVSFCGISMLCLLRRDDFERLLRFVRPRLVVEPVTNSPGVDP